jgi:diguanylate cyclase (GGDEF)-like protein/PAS domain S-box-containing protein
MLVVSDIATWRERIFSSLLSVVLVVGAIATLPVIPVLVKQGLWPAAIADTIALIWIFAIWRFDRLSYTVRVMHFLAVGYALAIALMLSVGTASMSYLLGPPVIAAILLSLRPAILALLLGTALLVALGASGHVAFSVPGWQHEPLKASLLAALNYAGVGAMLTLTCGTLLKGLSRSLGDAHALNGELQLTAAALARLNDMVLITRAVEGQNAIQPVTFVNDAFLQRTGYERSEIMGHSLRMLLGPETDQEAVARIIEAMRQGQPCNTELLSYTKAGEPYWMELEMVPFAPADARASHWVVVGRDITEQRQAAEAIHRLAYYDVLTGLPNRRLLVERLETMVLDASAGRGLGALLYLDLDNFKNVNDARGHSTGDALLRHAAARLNGAVRDCDTVARIGGDEFVVLIVNLSGDAEAAIQAALAMAGSIRAALAAPLDIDGHGFHIAASIGVALPLDQDANADALLLEADTAMYHAKAGGRDSVALFEKSMLRDAQQKLALERDLGQALEKGELAMHLQLQVDHAGTPAGAELLMRWTRADGSMVPPDVFIPVAEASGLIVPLGHWALRQACTAWLTLDAAGYPLPLSVNVSPLQFRQPDFVEQVRAVLAETGAPPQQLIFEVTEGLLIEDIDQTVARMRALSEMGIRFAIDDFGTGYSNLSYLKRLPLYELKIDKSLVRDMPHDQNGTAIVQSVLAMAGHLGLRVVAEGIETAEQAAFLAGHGRPCMQGYLFSRPMALDALMRQLDARPDLAA